MNDFTLLATAWLLRILLGGGILLAAAWLLMRTLTNPALREKLAGWAIRGAVFIAILGVFPAWLTIPVSLTNAPPIAEPEPIATAIVEAPAPPAEEFERDWVPADEAEPLELPINETVLESLAPAAAPIVESSLTPWEQFRSWVLVVYAVIASFALLQLALAMIALIRLRRSAQPVPEFVRELLPPDAPLVLVSPRVTTPVCFGFRTPTVLLPESLLLSATRDELRWVLAHELDHLRRGDTRTGLWVGLARAVYFALPWFWALRRDLRLAQEYLADAAAAAGRNADYAAFLVHLSGPSKVRRHSRTSLAAFPMRAGKTELFRRVSMLTQSQPAPGRVSRTGSLLTAGGVLAAAVALSGIGFADDKKPAKTVEVEVIVLEDDANKDGEKKKDGDKKKEGEKKEVIIRQFDAKIAGAEDAAKYSKEVTAALEKGDVAAAKEAMIKLNKVLAAQPKIATYVEGPGGKAAMVPADDAAVRQARLAIVREYYQQQDMQRKMDETMAVLQKELAAAKGDKAARAKIEAAIAELKAKAAAVKHLPMPAPVPPPAIAYHATYEKLGDKAGPIVGYALPPLAPAAPLAPVAPLAATGSATIEALGGGTLTVTSDGALAHLDGKTIRIHEISNAAKKMEEKIEVLKKALAEVDSPEAREALEKTINEFRKKLDEARKSAELKDKAPAQGGGGKVDFRTLPLAEGQAFKQRTEVLKSQIDQLKQQLAKLDGAAASGEFAKASNLQIEALEAQLKALADAPRFVPNAEGGVLRGKLFAETKAPSSGRLGIMVAEAPEVLIDQFDLPAGKYLIVTGTTDGSPAAKAGLKANDVLLSIAGKSFQNTDDVAKILAGIKSDEKFEIVVLRKGKKEMIKDVVLPKPVEVKKKPAEESDSIKDKGDAVKFSSMSVSVNNEEFTIDASNKEMTVKIVGHLEDGKPVADKVSGSKDGVDFSTKDLKRLSKSDRAIVEQLLKNVHGGK